MRCGYFGLSYQGRDLLTIVENREHPAIKPGKFSYNMHYEEMNAALLWQVPDPETMRSKPREVRAEMVALMRLKSIEDAINAYDANEEAKRKANRK